MPREGVRVQAENDTLLAGRDWAFQEGFGNLQEKILDGNNGDADGMLGNSIYPVLTTNKILQKNRAEPKSQPFRPSHLRAILHIRSQDFRSLLVC